jgi:hypothetical protein
MKQERIQDYHNDIFDQRRQSFPSNVKRESTRRTLIIFHHEVPDLSNRYAHYLLRVTGERQSD